LREEGVRQRQRLTTARARALNRIDDGEISGAGLSRHIDKPGRIDGDRVSKVEAPAAQERGIYQRGRARKRRIENRDNGVGAGRVIASSTTKHGLKRCSGRYRQVTGCRESGYVDAVDGIDDDPLPAIVARAAQ